MIQFPHGHGCTVSVEFFVAAWKKMLTSSGKSDPGWEQQAVPRHNQAETLAKMLPQYKFSVDVLCRRLVDKRSLNTMQATNPWLVDNVKWVLSVKAPSAVNGKPVNGALLTSAALKRYQKLSPEKKAELESKAPSWPP